MVSRSQRNENGKTHSAQTVFFLLLTLIFGAQGALAQNPFEGFAERIEAERKAWGAPGLAIAIVHNDNVELMSGFGKLDLSSDANVDENTLFHVGSTTKAFTAAAIGLLVEEGKLNWDDKVIDHLPEFRVSDSYVTREMTIVDLLSHRSGVQNTDLVWARGGPSTRLLSRLSNAEQSSSLRTKFEYNNGMYIVAGNVIESVSGKPFTEFVRDRIFNPLQMNRTTGLITEISQRPNVAISHDKIAGAMTPIGLTDQYDAGGAGLFYSSVSEYSNWLRVWLNNGKLGEKEILKPETVAAAFTPRMVLPRPMYPAAKAAGVDLVAYGLGWFLHEYRGKRVNMHTGSIDGMSAIVGLMPEENLGVVVFINGDHIELRHALMYETFDRVLGETRDWSVDLRAIYQAIAERTKENRKKRVADLDPNAKSDLKPEQYVGVYRDPIFGEVKVTYGDGKLLLQMLPLLHLELRPSGGHRFFAYPIRRGFENQPDEKKYGDPIPIGFVVDADSRPKHVQFVNGKFERSDHDVILRGGTVYNGSGQKPFVGDVAIRGDRVVAIGDLSDATGDLEIDIHGKAVAPGFINMLSWAVESLMVDGRSQSDIRQGVTLEVFGEGMSLGPWNAEQKDYARARQGDIKYEIQWTTLAEYLDHMVESGISPNIASFVGATTIRTHEIGYENRPPTSEELERMKQLVRDAMEDGALGIGSALMYAPAFYAKTDELIELCKVAAEYDGLYITHMRSEANRLLESVDEVLEISRKSGIRAEIYHLKAAGKNNWGKMDAVIKKIEAARESGLEITADMYTYQAGATGFDAAMPPWVQEGGYTEWVKRLKDPAIRARVVKEMRTPTDEWENLLLLAGSAEKVILIDFKNSSLKPLTGKTLAEVATMRGKSPEETAIDLVIEDGSRVGCVYFLMSEENVKKQIALPWVSFCSDAESSAPEGVFLKSSTHPRAYGNFARLLGKYVRDEKVIPLEEAIRRLTTLPANNLRIKNRGKLANGYFADVVVFDPETIQDHADFKQPQQFSEGIVHVFVNGVPVIQDGKHTGAKPGRVVYGPGRKN